MATVSAPELEQFAAALANERFGPEARRGLPQAHEQYAARRRLPLVPFALWIDGRDFPSFYAALAERKVQGASGEIRLGGPVGRGPSWEFLFPFRRLVLREDGTGDLIPAEGGASRRAVVRWLLREHVRLAGGPSQAPDGAPLTPLPETFGTLLELVALCRSVPLVPLGLALLVYLPEERARYELDLVHNQLLADPRVGRLAVARRVARTARFSWGLDRQVGRGRTSLLAARCLELLAETHGLTAVELATIFGCSRELIDTGVEGLTGRGLVTLDRRTARYHVALEAFLPSSAGPTAPELAVHDPALRTSVQELLAAAESRATCPLCGAPIVHGRDRLVCDDCARTVGLG